MLRICPGYAFSAVCSSVARARRFAPPPGRGFSGDALRETACSSILSAREPTEVGMKDELFADLLDEFRQQENVHGIGLFSSTLGCKG
ncbi:hypothetical protein KAM260_22410 [Klebsiella pneumoniae]|nr:hypothetical protein KAM260_22410 [Klebsiella pneumoniae]